MKKFNHPHIIELLGVVIDKQPPWIVMELAEHGEVPIAKFLYFYS